MKKDVVFFDTEVGLDDKRIHDIGATRNGASFHSADLRGFCAFASGAEFVCGHNIVHHDLQYTEETAVLLADLTFQKSMITGNGGNNA